MTEIIAVSNNKGGILKTTTVVNLAGVLARKGKRVLIVDADNQDNALLSFDLNPDEFEVGLVDILIGRADVNDTIVNVHENIDVIPSTFEMTGFEFEVLTKLDKFPKPFMLMKESFSKLKKDYDYILIDTPPSLGLVVGNVFNYAEKVLIPFVPEKYSKRSLMKVLSTIKTFALKQNPNLKIIGIFPTLVREHTKLHRRVLQEVKDYAKYADLKYFNTDIPVSIRYASSIDENHVPATLDDTTSAGVHYELLWKEIEEHEFIRLRN
jgi:chromosome partitioning protein